MVKTDAGSGDITVLFPVPGPEHTEERIEPLTRLYTARVIISENQDK